MKDGNEFFKVGCWAEGLVLVLGWGICAVWVEDVWRQWQWNPSHAALGALATVPPLGIFFWSLRSSWAPFRTIRAFLREHFLPHLRRWKWHQVFVLSLLAGVGEELLFRGAAQGGLGLLVGPVAAWILASLMFGLCHALTWGYIVLTTCVGLYLGGLWWATGNLLIPILTHTLYDLIALGWLVWKGLPED